jgi:hypothetical protein
MRARRLWLGFGEGDAYRGAAGGWRRLDRRWSSSGEDAQPGNVHAEERVLVVVSMTSR